MPFKGNLFQNLMNNFHSFPSPNTFKIFNQSPKLEYTINEWMKNWAPETTWKGENNFSLLNIGQQLQDTSRREQKSLQPEHRSQKINQRNISVKRVKKTNKLLVQTTVECQTMEYRKGEV
jgi:beta-xylosidase